MDIVRTDLAVMAGKTPLRSETSQTAVADSEQLRAVAQRFETSFIAEMLKHTGVGKMSEGFDGGPGEEAFSGLLTWEYAEEVAATGAIGLADQVYKALLERTNG